ncbi:MAG: molybdenum cofactor biosynthesis protein MoaE [Thermoleophilia bacterium]
MTPLVRLTREPLDVTELVAHVTHPDHGGIAVFLGTTRREAALREVVALDYDAYVEMAEAELARIAGDAARHGVAVAVAHRLGRVAVGEPSVAIAVSAGHRPEAFAACRFLIDEIKRHVPIWKQAIYADGEAVWLDGVSAPVQ